MMRAYRIMIDEWHEKALEKYILDDGIDPLESMEIVWRTTDTRELRSNIYYNRSLRPGIIALCLRTLDIVDVRKMLPTSGGPYRTS